MEVYGPYYGLPAWRAFNRCGFFLVSAGITNVNPINDGDTEIELSAFPTNLFAPIVTPLPGTPASGKGQRIVIHVGGAEEQVVQIKDFQPDPALVIKLESPVVLANPMVPIPAGEDVKMADSPVIFVGDFPKKVQFVAVAHALDDRAVAVNAGAMNLAFDVQMSTSREGPWHVPDSLALPGGIDLAADVAAPPDRITSDFLVLPPLPFLKLVPTGGTNGSMFSLYLSRSAL